MAEGAGIRMLPVTSATGYGVPVGDSRGEEQIMTDLLESLTTASITHSELLAQTAAILAVYQRRIARLRLAVFALAVWSVGLTVVVWEMGR